MHAKMTRDRKKLFISGVEKTIAVLEQNNKRMRDILAKQAIMQSKVTTSSVSVTPEPSPMLSSSDSSVSSVPPLSPASKPEGTKNNVTTVPTSNSGFSVVA